MRHIIWPCLLLLGLTTACHSNSIGKQFFKESFTTKEGYERAVSRLEAYPLEAQWEIFLYANQVIHPPLKGMAQPIAKQGEPALVFILEQLREPQHEADFRDSLVVFEFMQRGGYYDVCGDKEAMTTIHLNETKITHAGWQSIYRQMLEELCAEADR